MSNHDEHDDFGGLQRDLVQTSATMDRRQLLRTAARFGASLGALQLLGCKSTDSTASDEMCPRIPEETGYEGSGAQQILDDNEGIVRSDIRSSFGGFSGTALGIPLTIDLTIVSAFTCAPLAGQAVYLWHVNREGLYSLYGAGVTNQNYLRGVQESDASGKIVFTSIFPGCYAGRWPHIHFEVFPSLEASTNPDSKIATSQIALPKAACDQVYATPGYEASVINLSKISLSKDSSFKDGSKLELATVTGSVATGMTASLSIALRVGAPV